MVSPSSKNPHTAQGWVEQISDLEMPALASTVRKMESMSRDDSSSLAELGQSVLHDHALTSRILRVANSASFNLSHMQITTVSRAVVILGFKAIRNICITAKLLENMLKKKELPKAVYQRLLALIGQSFHAGMLAKMMTQNLSEDEQEEAFIAALLQHLGESAFWSRGGDITAILDEKLNLINNDNGFDKDAVIQDTLGINFQELNCGLAKSWDLGDVLIDSLEDAPNDNPVVQAVLVADNLSVALANPNTPPEDLQKLIEMASELMSVDGDEARESIRHWTEEAFTLASSFGADEIKPYIAASANGGQGIALNNVDINSDATPPRFYRPDESLQLQILREMAFLGSGSSDGKEKKPDFNCVIQTTLEGIYRGMGMDRAMVLLLDKAQENLLPRFVSAEDSEQLQKTFSVSCICINTFAKALKEKQGYFIDNAIEDFDTDVLQPFLPSSGFLVAPICIGGRSIGLFYADRAHSGRKVKIDDLGAFTHFAQQANLCLSVVMKH